MSKTNSNSITSILVAALNTEDSDFRNKIISIFSKKIQRKIKNEIAFYDCTHSPLLYKEMHDTEIDIIARYPGIHKPIMMIEIKANIGEPLQYSQGQNGYYLRTSKKHKIPLIYIIPKKYIHKEDLPKSAIKIYWEDILKEAGNINVRFDSQISQFVEISNDVKYFTDEEKKLFGNKKILNDIYTFKTQTLNIIKEILIERQRIDDYTEPEEVQWGVGFYYSFKSNNFFLGFNPYYNEQFDAFFALDIEETKNNIILGDEKHLIYDEGYYFIPILNNKTSEGDKTVLSALRKKLKDNKILEVSQVIKENFASFFCIQEKIGKVEMDKLFTEKQINEKQYEKMKKKFIR